jgi:hypothetical protein
VRAARLALKPDRLGASNRQTAESKKVAPFFLVFVYTNAYHFDGVGGL